jgi:hypothetical protein
LKIRTKSFPIEKYIGFHSCGAIVVYDDGNKLYAILIGLIESGKLYNIIFLDPRRARDLKDFHELTWK